MAHLGLIAMAPNTTDPLRTAAVRDFLEEYRDAHIEKTWEYDEEELPEMYDDHHTQAEIKVVQAAAEREAIPSRLSTPDGVKPIATYAVQIHTNEWERVIDSSKAELEDRLAELQAKDNPHANDTYSDGSKGQWDAWNRYCIRAVEWLLGQHPEQMETDQ